MSLFDISGSRDWGISEIAQILCQNFDQDNIRKKRHKSTHKARQKSTKKVENQGKTESYADKLDKASRILNGFKEKLQKQKFSTNSEDKIPLNNSFTRGIVLKKDQANKKSLKRPHSSELNGNKILSKKAKQETIVREKATLIKLSAAEHDDYKTKKQKKNKQTLGEGTRQLEKSNDKHSLIKPTKIDPVQLNNRRKQLEKLRQLVQEKEDKKRQPKTEVVLTLRQKMMRKLKAARFRFLNEQIYNTTSMETAKIFRQDPEAFKAYHEGYKLQVKRWPLNPVDKIIKSLSKMPKTRIIADFGCGEAKLAQSLEHTVHSFDLVAANEMVTACDMAHVPLQDGSVDVVVFCLSLMGTNLKDYLVEANRVLKQGGFLKIAEVESRFDDINGFVKNCEKFGFKKTWMDLSHNLFYFIDFKKETAGKDKKKLPAITLQPCLYKKR